MNQFRVALKKKLNGFALNPQANLKAYSKKHLYLLEGIDKSLSFNNAQVSLSLQTAKRLINFVLQYNILCFSTELDFEEFIIGLTDHNIEELERAWGYFSYRNAENIDDLLKGQEIEPNEPISTDDRYFATVLNNQGFVRVGTNLFRIIPEKERIIVANTFDVATINLMVTQPDSRRFRSFSFTDDVFAELEESSTAIKTSDRSHRLSSSECKESKARCAGRCKEEFNRQYCTSTFGRTKYRYKFIASHLYREYGVWHNLRTDASHKRRKSPPQLLYWGSPTNMDLSYNVQYTIRCRGKVTMSQTFLQTGPTPQWRFQRVNGFTFFYYRGTRALSAYFAYTQWRWSNACSFSIENTDIPFIQSQQ